MEKFGMIVFCLCLLAGGGMSALIYFPQLPVDKVTLFKAQIALNNWQRELDTTYGTSRESPKNIKKSTDLVLGELNEMGKQLAGYSNVVLGGSNGLAGSKNIIIGDNNSVYGNNNFIFSQGFYYADVSKNRLQAISNVLVNDNWVAELDKRDKIPTDLHNVIYPYW